MRRPNCDRYQVINLRKDGKSLAEIQRLTGFTLMFVRRWAAAADQGRGADDKPRSGRPRKLTPPTIAKVKRMMNLKKRQSLRKVGAKLNLHPTTVRRAARKAGLKPYRRPYRPLLTHRHCQRRLKFATDFKDHPWRNTMMSDEKIFVLYPSSNRKNDVIWAENSRVIIPIPRVTKPAGIHVWAGITYYGTTKLVRIEGKLNKESYVKILERHMLPAAKELFGRRDWWFQQDGATPHTARLTQTWLSQNVPNFIKKDEWPASTPDGNCIENLWAWLADRVQAREPTTVEGLWRTMRAEWNAIPRSILKNLIDSQPSRLAAIRESSGSHTKY